MAVVVVKAMGLGCLMVLMLILSTSHAGEADEEDDTVSSNQINIYLTIPKDPRNEMEKRAWNRGFYLGIGKRLSDNLNVQGIATMFMKIVCNTRSIRY